MDIGGLAGADRQQQHQQASPSDSYPHDAQNAWNGDWPYGEVDLNAVAQLLAWSKGKSGK